MLTGSTGTFPSPAVQRLKLVPGKRVYIDVSYMDCPSCGSLNSNCNHVGHKRLIVMFHNEKCTLQNSIHSNGFFDLKLDYGNKTTTKIDTSSSVDHLSLETKASSDSCNY